MYCCLTHKVMNLKIINHTVKLLAVMYSMVISLELTAQAPIISFEHFTSEHGLSGPVTHITQDNYGFLWLGTTDGLNRFDGVHFIVYRNIPGDTQSLTNNIINDLKVDDQGRVWAATNGGLCYYDYADDAFHRIHFDETLESIDQHRVHAITFGQEGTVWFATKTLLHTWKNNTSSLVYHFPDAENFTIKYLHTDDYNRIWCGSNNGVYVYHPESKMVLHDLVSTPFTIKNNLKITLHPIIPFRHDTLFTGSWYGGLQKLYISDTSIISIPIEDPAESDPRKYIIKGIAEGLPDQWWIGSYGNGLARYDARTNKYTNHFHHDPSNPKSLSDDYISDIFKDNAGIIWIGTSKGLDKYDPLTQQFVSVPLPVPKEQFSVYRIASHIADDPQDPDMLWICVSGVGLYHYNTQTGDFKLYTHHTGKESHLPDDNVYVIYFDGSGMGWLGCRSGLFQFDPVTKKATPFQLTSNPNLKGIHTIFEDGNKNIWLASHSTGIHKINRSTNQVTSFTYNPQGPTSLPDNRIFCMMQDSYGKIWVGTQNRGMCSYDPSSGKFEYFLHEQNNSSSIPDNGVYDLYQDAQHRMWIATENGFAYMDMATKQIHNFSTKDGLCNNSVFSITPDENNLLWLATNNGLSHFDPVTKTFRNYYTNDGLPMNRIDGDVFMSEDHTMYFGTTSMLSYCRPQMIKRNKRVPPVIITDYSVLGKKVPVMRQNETLKTIHLQPRENMITFNFATLNFTNSFLNQYAYKLEGFDEDWIYAGHIQSATYTNLDGGSYVFMVRGANNDGVWNETGTCAYLVVHPPFWRTWWFYALCTLAVAGFLYYFYRLRINQLMRLQSIRTRIARDLHDDIGSTLSSINMISSMAHNQPSARQAPEIFSTISSASHQAMELMSDIVWSINPKNDRMEMIITRMRQYASEILEAARIEFTLTVDEQMHDIFMPLDKRKDFYLIFKEAVNNLAKYSKAKQAHIHLSMDHHSIHLHISDDGVGFNVQTLSQGNGLKNMQARAQQLKGKLNITSTPSVGTEIDLVFPVSP